MLEVRYNTETGEVTGWCGDEEDFGNLQPRWGIEAIAVLDIPIPDKPLDAYLISNPDTIIELVANPAYTPPWDFKADWEAAKAIPGIPERNNAMLLVIGRFLGWE